MTDSVSAAAPAPSLTVSALWLLSAKAVGFAFLFLLPMLLARQLSQHDFGLYKQVFLVVGTAVSLLPLGFGMSAYYFLPRYGERRGRVVLNILIVYFTLAAGAAGLLTFRPTVLTAIFGDASLTQYAPAIGLIILLWLPGSVLETIAVANGQARLAGRFIVLLQFSKAALLLSAALLSGSIGTLLVAAAAHGVVQSAALAWYLSGRFNGCWRDFDWSVMRAQLSYGGPIAASTLLYWFQVDLHKYVVAHEFDAATYAIYAIGCFELPLLGILNESVGSVLIPRMSQLQRDGHRREIIRVAAGALRKLAAVHVPFYAAAIVAGPQLIALLFTDQYVAAWPIFAINMTLIPFSIPTIPCDAVIRAHAEHRYFLVWLRLGSTALLVTGLWLFLGPLGLMGAISVVVGVNLLERMATTVKAARILGMGREDLPLFRDAGRIVLAAAGAAAAGLLARVLVAPEGALAMVLLTSVTVSVAYAILLAAFRVPTADEWLTLRRLLAAVIRPRAAASGVPVFGRGDGRA